MTRMEVEGIGVFLSYAVRKLCTREEIDFENPLSTCGLSV